MLDWPDQHNFVLEKGKTRYLQKAVQIFSAW